MNTNDTWLIAGLGNPEAKYDGTRHNAGFAALDYLSGKWGISVSKTKFQGLWGQGEVDGHKVVLLKPLTYMNLSGDSIAPTAGFFKIPADHVIVLCDDITQNPGKLRIRPSGSAGGHNGLKSIIARLGGDNFPRIRIGVGARMDTHHAVLLSAPGDSASLTLDFGKICGNDDTGFVFGGKQGSLNAQINACEKYLSQLSETIRFPRDSSAYGLYPEKTAQMQDSLARYSARAQLSKAAKEWARQSIPARVYIQLRETLGFYQMDFPFLSQIASNDLQSLTFSGAQAFLTDYAQRGFGLFSDRPENKALTPWERIARFAGTQPASPRRDFMTFQLVAQTLQEQGAPDIPDTEPASFFESPYFSDRTVRAVRAERERTDIRFPETPLKEICYFDKQDGTVDTVSGKDIFGLLRSRYAGKVVYIDVWGTWCSPCIAQMSELTELQKKYEGKEVVFVTLAVWSPRERWVEMVGEGKIPGECFLFDFASATVFSTVCDFYMFPSHLLMDRSGRIVTRYAPVGISSAGAAIDRLLKDN